MKQKFIKAVENRDVEGVRLFLSNELMLDPRGISFNEMKSYAESELPGLYENDNGKTFSIDESLWNEDFLFSIKNELDSNFSREHLEFYEKVAKRVLASKASNLNEEESRKKEKKETNSSSKGYKYSSSSDNKSKYTKLTIGGTVVTIAGLCIPQVALRVALSSLGLAGVVIGGILLYNETKK